MVHKCEEKVIRKNGIDDDHIVYCLKPAADEWEAK
jgi:hypothetical protein